MEQLKLVLRKKAVASVMILNLDPSSADACESVVTVLRRNGIPAEIYLGEEQSFKAQLAYAVRQEYPVVLIIGSVEKERDTVQVKDMNARAQIEVSRAQVLAAVKKVLKL